MNGSPLEERPATTEGVPPLLSLRATVLLALAGAVGWLALAHPQRALGVAAGLMALRALHQLITTS
jgi:hypothetical protein